MSNNEGSQEEALGPSVVFGLVGAVVVLLLLAGGIWGVGKIISKIREGNEDQEEEQVAESEEDTEDTEGEGSEEDSASQEENEGNPEEEEIRDDGEETEDEGINGDAVFQTAVWIANDYGSGDIKGDTYTVVLGDTLWEIAEARYGSGFEWKKIRDANVSKIGKLPDGSIALIFPGQVLNLP